MLPITVNWERSPSAPSPVFGYNTKQNYSPEPTDNVYDSGKFDTINPNVFMGKRASDGKLNFQQYGKMFSQSYNADRNNSAWESNVSWAGNTGMSKRANYQGESVNFDQELNSSQLSSIIIQDVIPRLNKIQMGVDGKGTQDPFSASAKSDTDIWNHINQYVWGKSGSESSPKGDWAANPNAPIPQIWKNRTNIQTNAKMMNNLQSQINAAKDERDSIQAKLEGKAMRNHTHANYALKNHSHNNGGNNDDEKDCGWFGEKCWDNPIGGLIPSLSLTTVALGGLAAYFLLGKK